MCVHVTQEATHLPNTASCRCVSNVTRVLELYKEFQEEAYSVALHPSGLFMLVGFSDKLRLMNLLINDIRTFKEFTVRGCREVRCAGHVCVDCCLKFYTGNTSDCLSNPSVPLATVATCLQLSVETSFTSTLLPLSRTS